MRKATRFLVSFHSGIVYNYNIMSQFTNQQDNMLISLVKSNRSLYDASDSNYRSPVHKFKVWDRVSECMGVPDCKKRWKHLRDHYLKRKKLQEDSGALHKEWKYMNDLAFLNSHYRREINVDEDDSQGLSEEIHIKTEEETGESAGEDHSEDSFEAIEDPLEKNIVSTSVQGQSSRKRKRNDIFSSSTFFEVSERRSDWNIATERKRRPQTSNAIKKFFDSMGDIVSSFPPHLAAETRLKVCQIVTEMEVQLYKQGQVYSLPQNDNIS